MEETECKKSGALASLGVFYCNGKSQARFGHQAAGILDFGILLQARACHPPSLGT